MLETLLTKAVDLAAAETGTDGISEVCRGTRLSELPNRSLSATHPDLQREIASLVLAPSIPSMGPGSRPTAFSRFCSSSISSLVRAFAEPVNPDPCMFDRWRDDLHVRSCHKLIDYRAAHLHLQQHRSGFTAQNPVNRTRIKTHGFQPRLDLPDLLFAERFL